MQKMKTESKKIISFVMAVDIIMVCLLVFGIFLVVKKNQSLINLKNQIVEENAKISDLQSLKIMIEDTKDERSYISSLFVDKESVIDFIESIESLGSVSGSDVKVILVDENVKSETAKNQINVRFEAKGNWASVLKLIALLDHMPMALSVNGLEMSFEEEEVGNKVLSLWTVTFEISIYKNMQ